jgi:hypothetical protein
VPTRATRIIVGWPPDSELRWSRPHTSTLPPHTSTCPPHLPHPPSCLYVRCLVMSVTLVLVYGLFNDNQEKLVVRHSIHGSEDDSYAGGVTPPKKEDAPRKYAQFPIELLVTQDHENKGVEQVRPLQRSVDNRRKTHYGRRTSY